MSSPYVFVKIKNEFYANARVSAEPLPSRGARPHENGDVDVEWQKESRHRVVGPTRIRIYKMSDKHVSSNKKEIKKKK